MRCLLIAATLAAIVAPPAALADQPDTPKTVETIRTEAARPNRSPEGRPLPLVANWHERHTPLSFQVKLIRRGHHLMPFAGFPNPRWDAETAAERAGDDEAAWKQIAAWKLPVSIIGTQWEKVLYNHKHPAGWRYLPPEQSPLVWPAEPIEDPNIDAAQLRKWRLPEDVIARAVRSGKRTMKKLSPLGAVEPWREAGRYWTDSPAMARMQELYPDPPLVLMISNNEASDLRWYQVGKSKRFVERYGADADDELKRKVVADGWVERYGALFSGMRQGLSNPNWRKNARFLGYNAFGPDHFGRWAGWRSKPLVTDESVSWAPRVWDGAVPETYDNHWEPGKRAYKVWSMQTEAMNQVFMKDEALEAAPDFWVDMIFWDGFRPDKKDDKHGQYEKAGVEYSPELYRGWIQHVLWTFQPRVAREYRGSAHHPRDWWWPYFRQLIAAVDVVHADDVLARFWRHGALLANPDQRHPFDKNVPTKWQNVRRWYHLSTDLDPEQLKMDAKMPVYTLARLIGQNPSREWLIYAHAPLGDRANVEITIPEYRKITVNVPLQGVFYHVSEADDSIAEVGRFDQIELAPVKLDR